MKREDRTGPWLSTTHAASHRPGGGDEISPTDIGAATLEQIAGTSTDALAALERRVAALEAAQTAHQKQKAGVAHK